MENLKTNKKVLISILAVVLLIVVLVPVLLLVGCERPLVRSDEDLKVVAIVNQQLQDVLVPQYKGKPVVHMFTNYSSHWDRWNRLYGQIYYRDGRLFFRRLQSTA